MPLGEEPARRVHGDAAVERGLSLERCRTALPFLHEAQVLDVEDLGDREAVVHFGHVHVARPDARHLVGAPASQSGGGQPDEGRLLVEVGMVGSHPEPRHVHGLVGELVRPLGAGEDDRSRTVGLRAAVEQPQRAAHHGRGQHLLDGHLALEVGVGVETSVVMVLHGHRCQHLGCGPELVHVAGGERCEQHGCGLAAVVERVARRGPGEQPLLRGLVAHLLHADDEHHVVHAARHHHGADAEGVGPRRTGVLHPGAGDSGQPDGARHGVSPDALLAPQGAALGSDDAGVDLPWVETLVDTRQRSGEGARGHLLVALVEQLTHLDEACPDDGDLVPAHVPPS